MGHFSKIFVLVYLPVTGITLILGKTWTVYDGIQIESLNFQDYTLNFTLISCLSNSY